MGIAWQARTALAAGAISLTALAPTTILRGIAVGENVHVSLADAGTPMGEVLVSADPDDARVLLACAMVNSSEANRMWVTAYRSQDQGRTWARAFETRSLTDGNDADPSCTFGDHGVAYLAVMSHAPYGSFTTEYYLKLFRSTDQGVSWTQSVALPMKSQMFDREYLAVDRSGGPHHGTLYMNAATGVRGLSDSDHRDAIGLWVSRDDGRTFNPPVKRALSPERFVLPRANSVVLSDGTVVLLFGELNSRSPTGERIPGARIWNARGEPAARLKIATSSDGGGSLLPAVTIADCYLPPSARLGSQQPYLARDPGSTAFKDRLYVVWPDERSGRSEILLTYSADKGRTWSSPVSVNDDHGKKAVGGGGPDHFLPVVAVNRDGVVGVMWYDRRDVQDGLGWDIRFAASVDGGETLLPSVRASTVTSRFGRELRLGTFGFVDDRSDVRKGHDLQVTIQGRQFFAGDTAGMAADAAGIFHPVWIDHRTGTPQLWTTSVKVDGRAIRNGSPDLESLDDVSGSIKLEVQSSAYDQRTRDVSVTVVLRNTSSKPVPLPLTMRLLRVTSEVAPGVEALNADNGLAGIDALWTFTEAAPDGQLKPQATTTPRTLRFRLANGVSYRTDAGFQNGLVRLQSRILARSGQ